MENEMDPMKPRTIEAAAARDSLHSALNEIGHELENSGLENGAEAGCSN